MSWTKVSKHRWKISQEDSLTYYKKVHSLELQSRLVVEEDRIEADVAAVPVYPEAVAEAVAITPLH